ncbi:ABC transporter permease [Paenibacillus lutimineralis]|uniref:ABC transporter permease n=1 Tax=Paenibacillus lutimineralis TaxID=2707005 RepID=A0A3Q9I6J4_9BACL|nr:ABC transporter permease [Paenibacillus lutimineralis]AZS13811.1 ABC transporter permease [Paenibacillus lutimineralis]
MFGAWVSEMERIWKSKSMLILYFIFIALLAANIWGGVLNGSGTLRFGEGKIELNSLTVPWYMMDGISLLLTLVVLPVIYVNQLSGEIHSGAYRLYVLRPFPRYQIWLSKLLALAATTIMLIGFTFILVMAASWLLFPRADMMTLYGSNESVHVSKAILYNFNFYVLFALVSISKLMFCSAVCLFISRPLISFVTIFILSFLLYFKIAVNLVILADPFQKLLLTLRPEGYPQFWIYSLGTLIVCALISFVKWQRKMV